MILFPVYHSIYKLYSKNRTFVLFFCKNKAQDNILSHALLCYAMLCFAFYFTLFILYHTVHNRIRQCIQLCLLVCMHCRLDGKSCIKDRHILHFTDFLFNLLCRCRCPGSVFHNCNGLFLNSQCLHIGKQIP